MKLTGNVDADRRQCHRHPQRPAQPQRVHALDRHQRRRHRGERVIIFSGDNGCYTHAPDRQRDVNINSPTSGNWAGIALYHRSEPYHRCRHERSWQQPSWNISGLAYFPHAAITWSGIVGKATSGHQCFVLVIDTIRFNGTGGDARSRRVRSAGAGDAEQPNSHPRQTGGLSHVEDILSHEAAPRRKLGPRDHRVRACRYRADRRPARTASRSRAGRFRRWRWRTPSIPRRSRRGTPATRSILPAKSNCTGLTSAITTGLQTTSLGTSVTLASGYPTEGYYCVNSSGVLTNVANYSATPPATCSAQGDSTHAPGDYVVIQATYSYTPLVSSGLTVGSGCPRRSPRPDTSG